MFSSNSPTDMDFLFARLHGWWAVSAQGEALEALARSATVENFLHELQARGILTVRDTAHVNFEIRVRQYTRLSTLAQEAGGAAPYILACRETLTADNLKTLINYRFFPERVGHIGDMLVPYPESGATSGILEAVMAATDTAQFLRLLPRQMASLPGLAEIVRQLDKDRELVKAETAIDAILNRRILAAIETLPSAMRQVARALHGTCADCLNTTTLLRNQHFYHLSPEELAPFWMEGGTRLPRKAWEHLASVSEGAPEALLQRLPTAMQRLLEGDSASAASVDVPALENRMRRSVHAMARRHFYNAVSPAEALPAYICLLEDETTNLRRLHEAFRFGMPAPEIDAMLIA